MNSMIDLIKRIEKHPALYLANPYISCLRSFLLGWEAALLSNGLTIPNDFSGFQEWLAKKYRIETTHGWHSIILFYSYGESDALEKFFQLFNEWLSQKNAHGQ